MNLKEPVTPHKIALLLLIEEFCLARNRRRSRRGKPDSVPSGVISAGYPVLVQKCEPPTMFGELNQDGEDSNSVEASETSSNVTMTEAEMKTFMLTIMSIIQTSDFDAQDFMRRVQGFCNIPLQQVYMKRLAEMNATGIECPMRFFQTLPQRLFSEPQPMVQKASVIGLYVRRMVLSFETMSFSQVTHLYRAFQTYYRSLQTLEDVSMEDSMDFNGGGDVTLPDADREILPIHYKHGQHSQRQAEFFILQQSNLLQYNERKALAPAELQRKISELLIANPGLSDAHYLSYLNHLRVEEFCGAVHSLYHYFDRNQFQTIPRKDEKDEDSPSTRGYRYAILNLATLNFKFGHHEEALIALKEAVNVAQEYNDNVCLQHALSWLYLLDGSAYSQKSDLEKAVTTSSELHLSYLTSLGIQVFARKVALEGLLPANVFDHVIRSDIVNCQHGHSDLNAVSLAHKSSLWSLYGNRLLPTLYSQTCLNLVRSEHGVQLSGEASCISLCTFARSFADQGQFEASYAILNCCREQFPVGSQFSKIWRFVEYTVQLDQAMHQENWTTVDEIIRKILSTDSVEGRYRQAIQLKEMGDTAAAQKLLSDLKSSDLHKHPGMFARVTLVFADLCCQIGNPIGAIDTLLACIVHCKKYYQFYHEAMTYMHLAYVQFCLNLPNQALKIIEENLVTIISHGSKYDKARCLYLYAKCRVAASKDLDTRRIILLSVSSLLDSATSAFNAVGNQKRVKDVYYYQARLYHELGFISERNKYAIEFRKLDQLHPTLTQLSVNAF